MRAERADELLRTGEITLLGQLARSSNETFLVEVRALASQSVTGTDGGPRWTPADALGPGAAARAGAAGKVFGRRAGGSPARGGARAAAAGAGGAALATGRFTTSRLVLRFAGGFAIGVTGGAGWKVAPYIDLPHELIESLIFDGLLAINRAR